METPALCTHCVRMHQNMLRTTYSNALTNFGALHAKVAVDQQVVVLHGGDGDAVVWQSMTQFLEQNRRVPTCEEIMAELLA